MKKSSKNKRFDQSLDSDDSSQYWRPLKHVEKQELLEKYNKHLKESYGGYLSVKRRKRLLRLTHKEKLTRDSDFWSKLRLATLDTLVDLQLVCEVSSQNQLKEMFRVKEDHTSLNDIIHYVLLRSDAEQEYDDLWKMMFIKSIMSECLQYLETSSSFVMTTSHKRLIDEMKDLINALIGLSVIMPKGERENIKFR